jgi:hypothetical protein
MKTAFGFLLVMLMTVTALCVQFGSGHKSEEQIARMTPDQRVEEFCKEHVRHTFSFHDEYKDMLKGYLFKDGIKVIPQVIREIETYDPTKRESASQQKFRHYEAAAFILLQLDYHVFRMRAFAEGRQAIEALKRSSENQRIAHLNSKEANEYEIGRRYELHLSYVKQLEGISIFDAAIRDTLKYKYNIHLSDNDLVEFVNRLISLDPYYPGWSESKMYKEDPKIPTSKWLRIYDNPEPVYLAYMDYKAKRSASKQSQ